MHHDRARTPPMHHDGAMSMRTTSTMQTVDANEAVASVAYRLSEVIAIYPITPASPMGEHADEWSVAEQVNLWGSIPQVIEMQSEGGAAGAVHGVAGRGADHHLHRIAGSVVDAPQPVQDRRRADLVLLARGGTKHRHPRAVDLRGPLRCDGRPPERVRPAGIGLPPGSSGPRRHRSRSDPGLAGTVPSLLRRVPHLTRDSEAGGDR